MKKNTATLPVSKLTKSQTKNFSKTIQYDGKTCTMNVHVRYDDECGNGHNSFAITGEVIYRSYENPEICGCIHEEIEKHFPELKKYIKWHLTSSDGPMHYVANTIYHAKDREDTKLEIGAPCDYDQFLKFKNIPFTFEQQEKGFWEYLDSVGDFNNIEVEPVKYDGADNYDFGENFSLTGFIKENESKKWYKAPFKDKRTANEFLKALQNHEYGYIKIPTQWNKAVKPNIDAARSCAIWPDATLKQLSNEKALLKRLPKLIKEFQTAIEELGFIY